MAHYLEALDWQRRFMRIHTLLGGKSPHPQTLPRRRDGDRGAVGRARASAAPGEHPHPGRRHAPRPPSASRGLADIAELIAEAQTFVEQVYVPDVIALAGAYPDWAGIGAGVGNYLAFGEFPQDDSSHPFLLLPRGRIMGRQPGQRRGRRGRPA